MGVHELIAGLINASSGLTAELTVVGNRRELPATAGMAVYRVVQEALANAGKHAPGADVAVTLSYLPDGISVVIVNEVGEDADAVGGGQGCVECESGSRRWAGRSVRTRRRPSSSSISRARTRSATQAA